MSAGQTVIMPSHFLRKAQDPKCWCVRGGFWKGLLALIVCKHVYYQHVKYFRKSNKSALGGSVNPKGISVKLGMGWRTNYLTVTSLPTRLATGVFFGLGAICSKFMVCLVECESCFQAWKQSRLPLMNPGHLETSGQGVHSLLGCCPLHAQKLPLTPLPPSTASLFSSNSGIITDVEGKQLEDGSPLRYIKPDIYSTGTLIFSSRWWWWGAMPNLSNTWKLESNPAPPPKLVDWKI